MHGWTEIDWGGGKGWRHWRNLPCDDSKRGVVCVRSANTRGNFPQKMMNCSLNPHCMPPHTYLQQYGLVPHNITKYRKYVIVAVFSHFGTTFWHDEGSISLALISSLISCYIKLQFGPPFCPRRHRPEKEKILGSRPNAKQHQLSSGDLSLLPLLLLLRPTQTFIASPPHILRT